MVTIQQDFSLNELNNLLLKYGDTTIRFNEQAIQDDITRLKKDLKDIQEKNLRNKAIHKKNINNIVDYLERIIKKSDGKAIKINWSIHDNVVKSYPIEMKSIPEYKIYSTDYINLENGKMVYLDYKELADILAFEIMYRDLDETNESMEEKLSDVGIISISNSTVLTKYFKESPYELSKVLRISSSPYLVPGTNKVVDYFGNKEFDSASYRGVVGYSCRSAMSFVTEALMQKCATSGLKFKICGVFDTGIAVMVGNKDNLDIQKELAETIYIRTFGRKLEVKPRVQVF